MIAGSADVGLMVCRPLPGMAKSMESGRPGSRRVGVEDRLPQRPGPAVGRRRHHELVEGHRRQHDVVAVAADVADLVRRRAEGERSRPRAARRRCR